jgi:hypothetical protein
MFYDTYIFGRKYSGGRRGKVISHLVHLWRRTPKLNACIHYRVDTHIEKYFLTVTFLGNTLFVERGIVIARLAHMWRHMPKLNACHDYRVNKHIQKHFMTVTFLQQNTLVQEGEKSFHVLHTCGPACQN